MGDTGPEKGPTWHSQMTLSDPPNQSMLLIQKPARHPRALNSGRALRMQGCRCGASGPGGGALKGPPHSDLSFQSCPPPAPLTQASCLLQGD